MAAAIDRVCDGFLAIDAESGRVVDANPAAGALLGIARDALLGLEARAFVPTEAQPDWWTALDAMTEEELRAAPFPDPPPGQERPRDSGRVQRHTLLDPRARADALVLARPL